ncbi:hypothetical protein GCM10010347_42860 [Streptomyces cirratus]|uniref:Uncharacterized protein n=1 Tax=Streptomyces cirratus TaxID=68187 RepID=A0ABQ3F0S6_9ACTN|nr:hypothetical protein GCM10010347_42860 [Streptomyces cirratus]
MCEAGEPGQPTGIDRVDPGREHGTEAAREHLTEGADMPGGRVQFGTTGRDILETVAVGGDAGLHGPAEALPQMEPVGDV